MGRSSKRRFLGLTATALLGAGCLGGEQRPLGLREIEVINLTNDSKEVTVSVTKDGDDVYEETHTVGSSSGNETLEIVRDWMGDRTYYGVTVHTEIDGTETSASAGSDSLSGEFGDRSCFRSVAIIEPNDLGIAHGFYDSCKLQR